MAGPAKEPTGPRRIGSVISQLMSRRGYASAASHIHLTDTIAIVIGPALRDSFRVGKLERGVLNLHAADSVTMQEMSFQKRKLLTRLADEHPQTKIKDIRFRLY